MKKSDQDQLRSRCDGSSFQFLPASSVHEQQQQQQQQQQDCLYHTVPALFGLHSGHIYKPDGRVIVVSSRRPSSSSGFYKRLVEWLGRKKKSHRRYSEIVLPKPECPVDPQCQETTHGLVTGHPPSKMRNQSAPMIFDAIRPPRIQVLPANNQNANDAQQQTSTRLLPPIPSSPATPTTPTSCRSQCGIIMEKQESEDKALVIDPEWIIPWGDIQVGPVISHHGSCTINSGKWHGDVILHQFKLENVVEVNSFWSDVESLSKLRHENLLLFMGIATEIESPGPGYTIVNSAPRGASVFNFRSGAANGKAERIGMRAAVSISRQVAQATGYLHARGIVHGKLNPHNVFLEGDNYRVKLSLLDHGLVDNVKQQTDYACVPKMQVGYYSPELVRSIVIQPPEIHFTVQSTKFSDVYALGSFIYDLITGYPPFYQEEVDSILWRIGSGQATNLQEVNCNSRLKALMLSCWSPIPNERPTCVDVVRRLTPSALLCKSHSCSEPERLNRLGSCKLAC